MLSGECEMKAFARKTWQTCRLDSKYVKEFTSILKRDWIRSEYLLAKRFSHLDLGLF